MALPAGLSPATTTFEASRSDILSYGSGEEWSGGLMDWWIDGKRRPDSRGLLSTNPLLHYSITPFRNGGPPRIRTVFSPVKSRDFTAKVCSPIATQRRS